MPKAPSSSFRRGFVDGLPFVLTGGPFGLVYGLIATEAGFDVIQTLSMSLLVFGGASQFAALAQVQAGAPALLAVAAGLMVNLRMTIYSVALAPHLGPAPFWKRAFAAYLLVDNAYVTSIAEFEKHPGQTLAQKLAYYFATALPICVSWMAATLAGALGGRAIPESYGLDYIVPLAFLSLLAPMLRTLAHVAAAMTAVVSVLALAWMPFNTELIAGGLLGMAAGAEIERRMRPRC